MTVQITFTYYSSASGPTFDLYSDLDGFSTPFQTNVLKSDLIAGYNCTTVPDGTYVIRITQTGICTFFTDVNVSGLPSPTPTQTQTATPTQTQTQTPTNTASVTPSITATATATQTSTPTNTASQTPTITQTSTPTNTSTQTSTPSNTPTNTSTATNTPTNTATPTQTPTTNPLCPQQFTISDSTAYLIDNGIYSRQTINSNGSFDYGYFTGYDYVFGTAPDGFNYPIYGVFNDNNWNIFARLFIVSSDYGWSVLEQYANPLTGATVIGATAYGNYNTIEIGSLRYPGTGSSTFTTNGGTIYLSYDNPCPTPTQTPTNTSTPTQTSTNTQTPTPTSTQTQTPTKTQTSTPTSTQTQTPTPSITPNAACPQEINLSNFAGYNGTYTRIGFGYLYGFNVYFGTSPDTNNYALYSLSGNVIGYNFSIGPNRWGIATTVPSFLSIGTGYTSSLGERYPTQGQQNYSGYTSYPDFCPTQTPTLTPTQTQSPTVTPSITATNTQTPTQTPTNTPTNTATQTQTPSNTATQTQTPSNTPTNTPTQTTTPTNTASQTPTPSITASQTASNTPTPSITASQTPTKTATQTPTNTPTTTPTKTLTPTPTQICNYWNVNASACGLFGTVTVQYTSCDGTITNLTFASGGARSVCSQNKPVVISEPTPGCITIELNGGPCPTPTPTASPTQTPSNTPTPSITASQTQTPTNTNTPSITPSQTVTKTQTPTPSITASNTPTPSITASQTQTPSNSPTPSITASQTMTPTNTLTQTPTLTKTPTSTPTIFTPSGVTGLQYWFMSNSGSSVSSWTNYGLLGGSVVQSNASFQPQVLTGQTLGTYTGTTMRFQNRDFMTGSTTSTSFSAETSFIVLKRVSADYSVGWAITMYNNLNVTSFTGNYVWYYQSIQFPQYASLINAKPTMIYTPQYTNCLISSSGNPTTLSATTNGVYTGSTNSTLTGSTNVVKLEIGYDPSIDNSQIHDVFEFLSYNRILSSTEYNNVMNYLKTKYNYSSW